jgi:hypothetical protein
VDRVPLLMRRYQDKDKPNHLPIVARRSNPPG